MPLIYKPRWVEVNSAGVPYANAHLYVYKATTTNALTTYTDETFGTPLSQPIVADANGLFPEMHFDPSQGFDLHLIMKDQNDVQLWDVDKIPRSQTFFSSLDSLGPIEGTTATFSGVVAAPAFATEANAPYYDFTESDAAADSKRWRVIVDAGTLTILTLTDAGATGSDALVVTRATGTALTAIAIGNASDTPAITLNGTTLVAANISQQSTGSFTGTLTGMTTTTTGPINYSISGNKVTLSIGGNIYGTSNSTDMTLTGIPSNLFASSFQSIVCNGLSDNSNPQLVGTALMQAGNTIIFQILRTDIIENYVRAATNGFTASGTKGLDASSWCVTYSIA